MGRLDDKLAGATFADGSSLADLRKRQEAEQLAAHWLYLGNRAKERGQPALAERHYARAQKHHDEMNRLLGNGDGS